MGFNKRVLTKAVSELGKAKAPAKPKDIITDPAGQWKYPGQKTRIPGNDITMQGINYPVWAQPNVGPGVAMQPGQDYYFPDADYVDETPLAKKGGSLKSKKYSKSMSATNKLFAKNKLFKNMKSKIFDPNAKFKSGGSKLGPINLNPNPLSHYELNYGFNLPTKQDGGVSQLEGDLISKVIMNRNRDKGFVDRAYALGANPGTTMFNVFEPDEFGQTMSHKMAWGTDDNGQAWMFPTVLNPDNEAIPVPNQYADYVSSQGYKNATGMNQEQDGGENEDEYMDLTDEEIQAYRDGGYIVEELPENEIGGYVQHELVKAQKGGTRKPLEISDPNKYAFRKAAYDDSLKMYNLSNKADKYFNLANNSTSDNAFTVNMKLHSKAMEDMKDLKNKSKAKFNNVYAKQKAPVQPVTLKQPVLNSTPVKSKNIESKKPVQPVRFKKGNEPINTTLNNTTESISTLPLKPIQQFATPEQTVIPSKPYIKPKQYSGPRYGTLAGDENLELPEGATQQEIETARRKRDADEFQRKTLEYQQQRGKTPVAQMRKQGGALDSYQKKGEVKTFKRDIKDQDAQSNTGWSSAPVEKKNVQPTIKQKQAQKSFDKNFKVTDKSKYEKTEDKIASEQQKLKDWGKEKGIPVTNADLENVANQQWSFAGVGPQKQPDIMQTTPEQSNLSRAWEYMTNPMTAAEYAISGGGAENMPHNINEMRMAGIDPGVVQGRNLVGNTINSSLNLLDAGDKVVRNAYRGNYGDAALEALRFAPGSGLLDDAIRLGIKPGVKYIGKTLGTESGLLSKVDKAIYPTRTYRAHVPGGNETSYEVSELAKKINKKGDWSTKDLTEAQQYLAGTEAFGGKKGLLTGNDMLLTEYKVPFWKRNVSYDEDVKALKKLQNVDVNPNEFIIPNNKFLYPRRTNLIKAVPEELKNFEEVLPNGYKTNMYSPNGIPFSYNSTQFASKPYQYIEDQINAVTGHDMPLTYKFNQELGWNQNVPMHNWTQKQFAPNKGLGKFNAKELPGSPNSTPVQSGMLNPFAIADQLVPKISPYKFATIGMPVEGLGYMSGSPLNVLPFYGKKMGAEGQAFRKFGNSMADVIKTKTLSPAGGSRFRIGKDQIVKEGNWAAPNKFDENYPGVFGAIFDPKVAGSNLDYRSIINRNGVLVTDKAGNYLPEIPLSEPGMSFHRRLPFSNRYVPIDKEKLMNNKFQLATQGSHLQSLLEKYGVGLGVAAGASAISGNKKPLQTYNKYTIDPLIKASKPYLKGINDFKNELQNTYENNIRRKERYNVGGNIEAWEDELDEDEIERLKKAGYIIEELD